MSDSKSVSPSILRRSFNKLKYKFNALIPEKIKLSFLSTVARSQFLTAIYYLVNGIYYLEQRSVLLGVVNHRSNKIREDGFPLYTLLRNTHRLEKGLGAKNPKGTFAERYILETVTALDKVIESTCQEEAHSEIAESISWSIDVLSSYFDVVPETEITHKSKTLYKNVLNQSQYWTGDKIPYKRGTIDTHPVSYEALDNLASQRRSIRWFLQKQIPRDEIDRAISIAAQSPSACNRQAFEFLVYDDKELIIEISELAPGSAGYRENIPCLIVLLGNMRGYFHERDRHIIYIDASLAAMAFQFALETLGISSTCINWPSIPENDKAIKDLLNLSDEKRVVMLIALGYADPDGLILFSQKKNLNLIRSYNKL